MRSIFSKSLGTFWRFDVISLWHIPCYVVVCYEPTINSLSLWKSSPWSPELYALISDLYSGDLWSLICWCFRASLTERLPRLRVTVVGGGRVGKSALAVRLLTRRYIGEYQPTQGEEFTAQTAPIGSCHHDSAEASALMDLNTLPNALNLWKWNL